MATGKLMVRYAPRRTDRDGANRKISLVHVAPADTGGNEGTQGAPAADRPGPRPIRPAGPVWLVRPGDTPEPPAAAECRFGLTRREREVLRLLAQRLTNDEIAEQLFIHRSTVATHVFNLRAKLGATNRREAAALGRRYGLV